MDKKIKSILSIRGAFILFSIINLILLGLGVVSKNFLLNNNRLIFFVFSMWCTLFLYYLVYEAITSKKYVELESYKSNVIVIIIISIQAIFAYYLFYLRYEKFIRFWDFSGYWGSTIINSNLFEENVINGIKVLINTIFNDEYNSLPPLFLQSIFSISEKSKWAYILSVFIIYTIPVIACFSTIISRSIKSNRTLDFNIKFIIGIVILVFSPGLNYPALLGYLDIIGVVFICIILVVIKDYDFIEINLKKMTLIGIALILLFLSRRWYAYWIVGYFIALFISYFITDIFINKQYSVFLKRIKNICIFGIILLSIVLIFLFPTVKRILQSNFSFAYSAYKFGGIGYEVLELIKSLGIIPTLLMASGIIISIKDREKRNFSLILFIIPIVAIVLFNFIQTMGPHHRYLLLPSAIYFQAIGCISILDICKKTNLKNVIGFSFIAIYILNFIISINGYETKNLFSNTFCKPIIMTSYDENGKIVSFIEEKYMNTGEKTYVLASSSNYNGGIIDSYYMPDFKMRNMIYNVSNVDLRDGFPAEFLTAKYVIVVDPIQYHLKAEDQRIIGILAKAILNEPTISKHYEIEKVEQGRSGEKIYYLRQETPLDDEAKQFFVNEFNKYYKEFAELFENRILKQMEK
ncbi:hypothetical protein [Clostridium sp. ZS6]|uniref:hypothetical protein n=1 Tax=Clostridium sp. ZS6 TaxID=2949987 RepID=UPI00207A13EB|nr:hypothetical protein [Clostridium sp. ZS6]